MGHISFSFTFSVSVGSLPPLAGRLVPFLACSAANCLNIPLMRRLELLEGTPVTTLGGERLGLSRTAARDMALYSYNLFSG